MKPAAVYAFALTLGEVVSNTGVQSETYAESQYQKQQGSLSEGWFNYTALQKCLEQRSLFL